jgi:hypothetical protein
MEYIRKKPPHGGYTLHVSSIFFCNGKHPRGGVYVTRNSIRKYKKKWRRHKRRMPPPWGGKFVHKVESKKKLKEKNK